MSYHNDYRKEDRGDRFYHSDQRAHRSRKESMLGEILGELPIIGELLESIGDGRKSRRGIKRFCCCCAPIAFLLLIPAIILIYWIVKSSLPLFKVDISSINWLEQSKNWLISNFGLDQISQWLGNFSALFGSFVQ